MTISATTAWGSATGTGITGPYNIPFALYSQSHLTVLQVSNNVPTTMMLGTDYTFTAWVPDNKGQVAAPQITFTSVVAGGIGIIFLLTPPGTQDTEVTNYDAFFPAIHEIEFDLLAQKTAQLLEWAGKTLKAPDQEQAGSRTLTLAPAALRALTLVGFDASGNYLAVPMAGSTTVTLLQALGLYIGPAAVANNAALLAISSPQGGWVAYEIDDASFWVYNALDNGSGSPGWVKLAQITP